MDYWVERAFNLDRFTEPSKVAQSTFENLIEDSRLNKDERTCNILLMGNYCVGKSSTMKNIAEKWGFVPCPEPEKEWFEDRSRVFSFEKGDLTLNFIDTEQLFDTGCWFMESLLVLFTELRNCFAGFVDVILYVDRADAYNMNAADLFLAKAITELFGEKAWERVLIVLTHSDALEESTEKDFRGRWKEELLDWIVKGGDIKEDVKDTLEGRVVFIDNAKNCNEPKNVEEIHDGDDDLPITALIKKIADENKGKGSLKAKFSVDDYIAFSERIIRDCWKKYFKMINNVDNPKGEEQEWTSFNFDDISSGSESFPTFEPKEWKIDHLPQSAQKSIQDFKSKLQGRDSFTILVMGRGGVGKSSIANSIIGATVFPVYKTKGSQEILVWSGSISNFTLRIIEIPGFVHFGQVHEKYFEAILLLWKKYQINAFLYVERLDEWKRDDLTSKTIGNFAHYFGPENLKRALIVLTHRMAVSDDRFEEVSHKMRYDIVAGAGECEKEIIRELKAVGAPKAVGVENSKKYRYQAPEQGKFWMVELFEGLSEISERQGYSTTPQTETEVEMELEYVKRGDWLHSFYPRLFGWWEWDFKEKIEENVRVMISFHNTKRRQVDPDGTPKRCKCL